MTMSSQQATAVRQAEAGRFVGWLEENGFLVFMLGMCTVASLLVLQRDVISDSWLGFVSGRWIVQHGLPSENTLTVMAHGRRWVDQQWLAQLLLYGLVRIGGLKLAVLVQALLSTAAIGGAALVARRLGASARAIGWVVLPAFVAYYSVAWTLRAQMFALPLFTVTLWLLLSDARQPSRRVFFVLPLLVLWANLHGSVILGCLLVSLHGATLLRGRPRWRGPVLLLAPWACLFASPYAPHLAGYYGEILLGSGFRELVAEWAPTTLSLVNGPVYLIVLGGLWLLGRKGRALPLLDQLIFILGSLLAFDAIRNTPWIALIAVAVLPAPFDRLLRPLALQRRPNRVLGMTVLALLAVGVVIVAASPASSFSRATPSGAVRAAADAAGREGRVFATSDYADRLLWSEPQLAGRVAYDDRLELLSGRQLAQLAIFQSALGRSWRSFARRYRVFVLSTSSDRSLERELVRGLPARVVFRSPQVVVLRRL
jgi:hypothetical protein